MDATIIAFLTQDGLITGAVYALLAVAIVLIFTVTRVIFVPQGDFVAFSALTMAAFQSGKTPGTIWLLAVLSTIAMLLELWDSLHVHDTKRAMRAVLTYGVAPAALVAVVVVVAPMQLPMWIQAVLSMALVTALGPLLYRAAFAPVAHATVLV